MRAPLIFDEQIKGLPGIHTVYDRAAGTFIQTLQRIAVMAFGKINRITNFIDDEVLAFRRGNPHNSLMIVAPHNRNHPAVKLPYRMVDPHDINALRLSADACNPLGKTVIQPIGKGKARMLCTNGTHYLNSHIFS